MGNTNCSKSTSRPYTYCLQFPIRVYRHLVALLQRGTFFVCLFVCLGECSLQSMLGITLIRHSKLVTSVLHMHNVNNGTYKNMRRALRIKCTEMGNSTDTVHHQRLKLTLGALGDEASAVFGDLGRRTASVTAEPRSSQFLMQRLSVALQRGNAACILGTVPSSHGLDDLFYLQSIHNLIVFSIVILFICVILAVTVFFCVNLKSAKSVQSKILYRYCVILAYQTTALQDSFTFSLLT